MGISRGLLQAIKDHHHTGLQAFLLTFLDFIFALFFLILMSVLMVVFLEISNIIDTFAFFNSINANFNNIDYYWIYFMVFSTFLPTLIHFALAGGALVLVATQPIRNWLISRMHQSYDKLVLATIYLTVTPIIGLIVPILLLYLLFWILLPSFGSFIGENLILFLFKVSQWTSMLLTSLSN